MRDGNVHKVGRFAERALKTTWANILTLAGVAYTLTDVISRWHYETPYRHFWGIVGVLALVIFWLLFQLWLRNRMELERDLLRKKISNYLLLLPVEDDGTSFYMNWLFALTKETRQDVDRPIYVTPQWASKNGLEDIGGRGHVRAMTILEDLDTYGWQQFDGMFAIVNDPDSREVRENLLRYTEIFDGNLILLDMNMDFSLIKERAYPKLPFVGSDEVVGGEGAARLAHDYFTHVLKKKEDETIKVLILEKYDTEDRYRMWDSKRILAFKASFEDSSKELYNKNVEFHSIKGCEYNREKTRSSIETYFGFKEISDPCEVYRELCKFDVIFASNDDSALGAQDAIKDLKAEISRKCECAVRTSPGSTIEVDHDSLVVPGIIGYDGTKALKDLLKAPGDGWIIGTVDVQLELQARKALDEMERLVLENQEGVLGSSYRDIRRLLRRFVEKQSRDVGVATDDDPTDDPRRMRMGRGSLGGSDLPEMIKPRVVLSEKVTRVLHQYSTYPYDY